jgi:hypothetical protein
VLAASASVLFLGLVGRLTKSSFDGRRHYWPLRSHAQHRSGGERRAGEAPQCPKVRSGGGAADGDHCSGMDEGSGVTGGALQRLSSSLVWSVERTGDHACTVAVAAIDAREESHDAPKPDLGGGPVATATGGGSQGLALRMSQFELLG